MKSVLFVAAEGLPYIKTGGLADVIGSLPKILNEKGMDARVVLPLYKRIAEKYRGEFTKLKTIPIHIGVIDTVATIYQSQWESVTYYFIEHAGYFRKRRIIWVSGRWRTFRLLSESSAGNAVGD